jgi:hypothetical protein
VQAEAFVHTGSSFEKLPPVTYLTLARSEALHDHVMLQFVSGYGSFLSKSPSAAVVVDVQHAGQRILFYGYLDVAQPAVVTAQNPDNRVNLLGVTHVMRTSTARSWTNQLPHVIVQDIMRPYHMGLEMDQTNEPCSYLAQTEGESDWQVLARLIDSMGYSLSCTDGIVRVVDTSKELRRSALRHDVTQIALPRRRGSSNVTRFQVTTTTTPSGTDYRDTLMYGIDSLGQHFEYRTSFEPSSADIDPEFTVLSSKTFGSLQDAVTEARRVRSQARFTQVALAGISGYLQAQPGRYVAVHDVEGQYNGWWFCTDVKYAFSNTVASTEMTLGYRSVSSLGNLAVSPARRPSLALHNGRWQLDRDWTKVS